MGEVGRGGWDASGDEGEGGGVVLSGGRVVSWGCA